MTEYKQRCPGCYAGSYRARWDDCKLCAGTGYLRGNGAAQLGNINVKRRAPIEYDPGQFWDNLVRAAEEVA